MSAHKLTMRNVTKRDLITTFKTSVLYHRTRICWLNRREPGAQSMRTASGTLKMCLRATRLARSRSSRGPFHQQHRRILITRRGSVVTSATAAVNNRGVVASRFARWGPRTTSRKIVRLVACTVKKKRVAPGLEVHVKIGLAHRPAGPHGTTCDGGAL